MKSLLLLLPLAACASAPEQLVAVNDHVNSTRPYQHYYGKDYRYLKEGEAGNCAARAYTKMVDLQTKGIPAHTEQCYRASDLQPHAYTVAELMGRNVSSTTGTRPSVEWVLDREVVPYADRDCLKRKGE